MNMIFLWRKCLANCFPRRVLALRPKPEEAPKKSPRVYIQGISKCKKVSTVSKFQVCEKNLDLIKLGAHGGLG